MCIVSESQLTKNKISMKNIQTKAVLVNLNISTWLAAKTDKKVTLEVLASNSASSDAGNFRKYVLPDGAYRPIQALAQNIRRWHYSMTLPWMEDGTRILPAALQMEYADKLREFKAEFDSLVATQFSDTAYAGYVAEAQTKLGNLFNPGDYPAPDKARAKFGVRVTFLPLPEVGDFRLDLNADQLAEMKASLEAQLGDVESRTKREIYSRLGEKVAHLSAKLTEFDKADADGVTRRLHGTLIENIREVCRLIPGLNITGDPEVEKIKNEALARLARWEIETIRDDEAVRKEVIHDADAILKSMGLA